MRVFHSERGDTLIEVLLAMSILSIVIVTAIGTLNRGIANILTSTEHTSVQQQIVGQAEQLNYARDNYMEYKAKGLPIPTNSPANVWQQLIRPSNQHVTSDAPDFKRDTSCANQLNSPIYLDLYGGDYANALKPATVYTAELPSDIPSRGLWIEGYESSTTTQKYIDFIIRACWQPISDGVIQQESTVVRLYNVE